MMVPPRTPGAASTFTTEHLARDNVQAPGTAGNGGAAGLCARLRDAASNGFRLGGPDRAVGGIGRFQPDTGGPTAAHAAHRPAERWKRRRRRYGAPHANDYTTARQHARRARSPRRTG